MISSTRSGRRHALLLAAALALTLGLASRAEAFVYWANQDGNTIGRANLNGSSVDQKFITGATDPCGAAVAGARTSTGQISAARLGAPTWMASG